MTYEQGGLLGCTFSLKHFKIYDDFILAFGDKIGTVLSALYYRCRLNGPGHTIPMSITEAQMYEDIQGRYREPKIREAKRELLALGILTETRAEANIAQVQIIFTRLSEELTRRLASRRGNRSYRIKVRTEKSEPTESSSDFCAKQFGRSSVATASSSDFCANPYKESETPVRIEPVRIKPAGKNGSLAEPQPETGTPVRPVSCSQPKRSQTEPASPALRSMTIEVSAAIARSQVELRGDPNPERLARSILLYANDGQRDRLEELESTCRTIARGEPKGWGYLMRMAQRWEAQAKTQINALGATESTSMEETPSAAPVDTVGRLQSGKFGDVNEQEGWPVPQLNATPEEIRNEPLLPSTFEEAEREANLDAWRSQRGTERHREAIAARWGVPYPLTQDVFSYRWLRMWWSATCANRAISRMPMQPALAARSDAPAHYAHAAGYTDS